MDRNRNNYRPPTIILAALLASTLTLPKAVSAHGREGRDREKMSALLQSLFEMKEARAASGEGAQFSPLGTVDVMLPASGAPGLEGWAPLGRPSAPEQEGGGSLGATWSGPSRMRAEAPLSHPSPPSEPFHLGLLRVTGAKASGRPTAALPGSGGGGAGMRRAAAEDFPARLRGDAPDEGGGRHDFVRDLRRQFELRQQRAQARE
jgi:hypothetical protein